MISITHNSISITHNSKYVGSTIEKCVWHHNSVFISITQFSYFWMMSYGNWKYILGVFSFQNSIFNRIFVIKHTFMGPMAKDKSRQAHLFLLLSFSFFLSSSQTHSNGIFFFFFILFLSFLLHRNTKYTLSKKKTHGYQFLKSKKSNP